MNHEYSEALMEIAGETLEQLAFIFSFPDDMDPESIWEEDVIACRVAFSGRFYERCKTGGIGQAREAACRHKFHHRTLLPGDACPLFVTGRPHATDSRKQPLQYEMIS